MILLCAFGIWFALSVVIVLILGPVLRKNNTN